MLARPFDHGAAVMVYSATKYLGGHGTSIGGVIVDGGNFDWGAHPERQPALNTPDPSYHGAVWSEAVKPLGPDRLHHQGAGHAAARSRLGALALQRLPDPAGHGDAAAAHRAPFRERPGGGQLPAKRPEVTRVIHPAFQTGVARERADKYLKGGYGGLVGFELAAGKEAGRRFIDALELFYHVANIGDARSLAIHPATTTHSQLTPADQLATGVSDGYVRLSVGLEHIDDIVADLERGLAAAGSLAKAA